MLRAWGQGWAQDTGQEQRLSWQGGTAATVSDRAGVTPDFSSQNIPAACRAGGELRYVNIRQDMDWSTLSCMEPFIMGQLLRLVYIQCMSLTLENCDSMDYLGPNSTSYV